jgi:hypothetical protein
LEALMRIDLYTKTILTITAVLLAVVVSQSLLRPNAVSAQSALAGVQFTSRPAGFLAIDTKAGEVWLYDIESKRTERLGKLTQLGKPIQP